MCNSMDSFILLALVSIISIATQVTCLSCNNPKVTVVSFSTEDASILTQIAHIGEFTLKCNDKDDNIKTSLFAEFPCGKIIPVAQVNDNTYQISWIEDIKKNSNDNLVLRLYDEEGYANLRKTQRDSVNIDSDGGSAKMGRRNIKSLIDITIPVKGVYKGPWIKAEILAALVMAIIAYFAISVKGKVQS